MRWIVVDGIDGSGKTTHANWIKDYYEKRGESTIIYMHPSSRLLGRLSRRSLQGSGRVMQALAGMFFMMDVLNSLRIMRRQDAEYDNIVFVRYLMATAYLPGRLAKTGYTFFAKFLPVPERLLLVDIDPAVALRRISARKEKKEMFEDILHLTRTREKVLSLTSGSWEMIDNSFSDVESHQRLDEILFYWDSVKRGSR
jgi:dTMP kinase